MNRNKLKRMVITAVLLAIGIVLPFLIGQVRILGKALSPLHIPVLICGLTCGWSWGAALGIVLPILRGAMFGMPPLFPTGVCMAVELGVYGLLTGLLYPVLRKGVRSAKLGQLPALLAAMLIAMVAGRLAGGAMQAVVLGLSGKGYTFEAFVASYFVGTSIGAVLHLIIVPAVVISLERAGLSPLTES